MGKHQHVVTWLYQMADITKKTFFLWFKNIIFIVSLVVVCVLQEIISTEAPDTSPRLIEPWIALLGSSRVTTRPWPMSSATNTQTGKRFTNCKETTRSTTGERWVLMRENSKSNATPPNHSLNFSYVHKTKLHEVIIFKQRGSEHLREVMDSVSFKSSGLVEWVKN